MKVFVYVMTHLGDPDDESGVWGCCNCMGKKRSYPYKAVIGVGGINAEDDDGLEFAHKVKWVGIGPDKKPMRVNGELRHVVTFDHFLPFDIEDPEAPDIREVATRLAARIRKAPRGFMNLTLGQHADAEKLLKLAKTAPPSPARAKSDAAYEQASAKDLCSATKQRRRRKQC